jgi:hypothetical protein
MDEGTAKAVDQRVLIVLRILSTRSIRNLSLSLHRQLDFNAVIIVHDNTPIYFWIKVVERSLGTNIEVYPRSITLTYS